MREGEWGREEMCMSHISISLPKFNRWWNERSYSQVIKIITMVV